jgi:hypothetical protein
MTDASSANITDTQVPDATATTVLEPIVFETEAWERWFAWRPVKLYMTPNYAWLRTIYRRCVTKNGLRMRDYTDQPQEYPCPQDFIAQA